MFDTTTTQGLVNYDLRARNLQLESDTAVAIHTLHDIEAALPLLPLAQVIHLQTMYQVPPIPTTIERECAYLLEHTVHHLAMVRVGLKIVAPTLSLAADFGVAKATVAHQKASA